MDTKNDLLIRKVWKTGVKKCITIPEESDIEAGDYVAIKKITSQKVFEEK